jgi:hypothetical protein
MLIERPSTSFSLHYFQSILAFSMKEVRVVHDLFCGFSRPVKPMSRFQFTNRKIMQTIALFTLGKHAAE